MNPQRGISDDDRAREPYRWCIHCDVDCEVDEPEHTESCPSSTGVYPIVERDMHIHPCPSCECGGMACMDCGEAFKLGDFYTHRQVDTGRAGRMIPGVSLEDAPIGEIICLGCAALWEADAA